MDDHRRPSASNISRHALLSAISPTIARCAGSHGEGENGIIEENWAARLLQILGTQAGLLGYL
jgi:hypothetical protein